MRVADPVDFWPAAARVTVDVDGVGVAVVERVSVREALVVALVDDAALVSAADWSGRSHAVANTTATKAPASESFVIDLCQV